MRIQYNNRLLRLLDHADMEALSPHLERVSLTSRQILLRLNAPVEHVYFPESGQLSTLAKVPMSEPIETGMVGWEGMSDMALGGRSPMEVVVQLSGEAFRIEQKVFVDALLKSASLTNIMLRYQTALLIQVSYTALSHGGFTVPERLARWLLMVHDRAEGDEFPLVHEFFSWMLAVRRAGVTEALRELRLHGAISTGRGTVKILDRDMLIELASGSYGPPEAEYERLLGKP